MEILTERVTRVMQMGSYLNTLNCLKVNKVSTKQKAENNKMRWALVNTCERSYSVVNSAMN